MNLREIQHILMHVPLADSHLKHEGQILSNLNRFKSILPDLAEIPQFRRLASELQESILYSTGQDSLTLAVPNAYVLKLKADNLISVAQALLDVLAVTVRPVEPETILVRLPNVHQLSDVNGVLGMLQTAIGQLVSLEGIGGEVEIPAWESGSLLLYLYLKCIAAVEIVGRALRAAALAYQEVQKGRIIGQHVNILKVKVESLNDIRDAQAALLKELIDQQARAIETDTFSNHVPERHERIKHSIKLMAELLERGTVITPALEMPKTTSDLYPDLARLNTVVSQIKQLEDSQSSPTTVSEKSN